MECNGCTFLFDHVKCRLIALTKDNKIPCDNWGITKADIERLQGWADGYTDVPLNGKPASDANRYKALGNGMAQPCARFVIRRIAEVANE
jgi:site-specific DNA-cytosine methylase